MVYDKENYRNKTDLFWIYTNLILNNILDETKLKNQDVIIVDPINELYTGMKDKSFHEDGIQSAANLCKYLDVDLPWKRNKNFISRPIQSNYIINIDYIYTRKHPVKNTC